MRVIKLFFKVAFSLLLFFGLTVHFDKNPDNTTAIYFSSGNEALAFSGGLGFAYEWEGSSVNFEYDILTSCLTTTTTTYDMRTCHNSQSICTSHQIEIGTTTEVTCDEGFQP